MENVLPMKFSVVQHLWNFIKKQTSRFADVYGPYQIKKGEGFIFAQQMNYDPAVYQGEHVIKTRLMKEGSVIVENEFEVDFE